MYKLTALKNKDISINLVFKAESLREAESFLINYIKNNMKGRENWQVFLKELNKGEY